MNSDGRSTSQQLYIPTLLVVGGCEGLLTRCQQAADESGLAVKTCTLGQAPEAIPYRHPLAIVVPNLVFATAADELEALARDVRSVLFPVDVDVTVRELLAMFAAAIAACSSQRERRGGAGRYSITDGVVEEAPFSRRDSRVSLAPPSVRSVPPAAARSTPPPSVRSVRPPRAPTPTDLPAPRHPGLASTSPSRARPSDPPVSGVQSVERPSYAAFKAVFSSR